MRTLLTTLILLAPLAAALPANVGETYAFANGGSVLVDVRYADGIATTKFGFSQLAGEGGGPSQRLEAGALCTEWIGTFTQVLIEATSEDRVASATFIAVGYAAGTGSGSRSAPGFTLDALGAPGAFEGSLLVCDDAAGEGKIRFLASVERVPLANANAATIRLTEG